MRVGRRSRVAPSRVAPSRVTLSVPSLRDAGKGTHVSSTASRRRAAPFSCVRVGYMRDPSRVGSSMMLLLHARG
ncbi:hypothetical protein F2Q68_00019597 [Brassica cretica]|uniref:Uncharacterized protein n=1 Tax=Brassica cretica TaxID=69181 RepID=A0A8S9G0M8_BRACR|nr:hypothetical protein F2Q68_00019597 [Brassica cretica]